MINQNYEKKPFIMRLSGKIKGKNIEPETMSLENFNSIFGQYRDLISASIKDTDAGFADVNFKYTKGSVCLESDIPTASHNQIKEEIELIRNGSPVDVRSSKVASCLYNLKGILVDISEEARISFGDDNHEYFFIDKKTIFEQFKEKLLSEKNILYGKIFSVGGKNPNIHIATEKEQIIIDLNEDQARELATKLYQFVGVQVELTKDISSGKAVRAKFIKIIPYSREINESKFAKDKKKGKLSWKGVDPVKWENEIRGYGYG